MNLIYVGGPYRAKTEWGVAENIHRAELAAIELWKKGWAVICPHKNTAFFGGICDDQIWLSGDLEIIRRCDAVCLIEGWDKSRGSAREKEEAERIGLKIYFGVEAVPSIARIAQEGKL
jgi:hypothetical protein